MNNYDILKQIENINPQNLFIQYIIERIQDDDYRGIQCSQHNRLTMDYFVKVIDIIYKFVGESSFVIHIGDDNGQKQPEAKKYYAIVESINQHSGKATINSLKKNTFPDLQRAGFLKRFSKDGEEITTKRSPVYKVCLSALGVKFATSKNTFERMKYYTEAVDKLTYNSATELVELLTTDDRFDTIDILEFMYILSDDRTNVTYNDKINYLSEYRLLNKEQQRQVTNYIKMYCNPQNNKSGNKVLSRDYSNWKNEAQQIFSLFSNSTYFKVVNNKLYLNNGDLGLFLQQPKRKNSKTEYFDYHNIKKQDNYELHHIIPFKRAERQAEAQLIDDKRNLIYVRSDKHSEFTSTHNINVRVSYIDAIMLFLELNTTDNIIKVNLNTKEAIVSKDRVQEIINYNKQLLKKFYNL